jgi:hypothetical protein
VESTQGGKWAAVCDSTVAGTPGVHPSNARNLCEDTVSLEHGRASVSDRSLDRSPGRMRGLIGRGWKPIVESCGMSVEMNWQRKVCATKNRIRGGLSF